MIFRKDNGIYFVRLGAWRFGVGPLCAVKLPWSNPDKYYFAMRWNWGNGRTAWQVRVLWFYVGRYNRGQ